MKVSSSKPSSYLQSADKFRATRPLDYIYDPLFTFSGPKDYYKSANDSLQSASEYTVRPIFDSMFSDMARYPRANLELRPAHQMPRSVDTSYNGKIKAVAQERTVTAEVTGSDRYKYFRRPVTEGQKAATGGSRFPLAGGSATLGATAPPATALRATSRGAERSSAPRHAAAQTALREAEAQTAPWQPECEARGAHTPEVLHLDRLKWGDGLPPGRHEVDVVERLRMKRAWESVLPPPDSPSHLQLRYRIIADIEKSDWLFRDREIQSIHNERMKQSEKQMEEHKLWHRSRLAYRLEFLEEENNKIRDHKLKLIRRDHERALRKLCMKERGYNPKQKKRNIVEEHLVQSSEPYTLGKKMGTTFNNRHEALSEKHIIIYAEDLSPEVKFPERKPTFDFNKASQPKKQTELCPRETRWTVDNLAQLHHDLQTLRAEEQSANTFSTRALRRVGQSGRTTGPSRVPGQDEGERLYRAAALIQRVVRGRAEQALMYEARDRWREVLNELKSNQSLSKDQLTAFYKDKEEANAEAPLTGVVQCIIGNNVGSTIAQTLDLLASELLRFRHEGVAHGQALQAEYDRIKREAQEGGRRQLEMRRREEHNLMFAQLLEEYQRSIEDTLTELVARARENEAKAEAYEHAKEVARLKALAALQEEELEDLPVSPDLLFDFIAPDGLRELTRTCMLILKEKYAGARRRMLGQEGSSQRTTTTEDQPMSSYEYGYSQDYGPNFTEEDETTVTMTGPALLDWQTEGTTTSADTQEMAVSSGEGRRFGLAAPSQPEDRLLARVMRDMCFAAGALLHTAAKILNRALQIANIPRESFEEALRRTMCVINEAREEIFRLIMPPTKSKTQEFILPSKIAPEGTIQEALRIVNEIIAKARERIAKRMQASDACVPRTESEVRSVVNKVVDEVIREAQMTVLKTVVEDFLVDLLREAEETVEVIKKQSSP